MIFYAFISAGPQGWCCNLSLKWVGLNSPQEAEQPLTFCILMDFPIHIDTISMGLVIMYF